jgi:hypothetical protein
MSPNIFSDCRKETRKGSANNLIERYLHLNITNHEAFKLK